MWQKQLIKLRMLVIEDYKRQRRNIVKDILGIDQTAKEKYSVSDFQIDEADCLEEAISKLKLAASLSLPYHLVLLDLGIPLVSRPNVLSHDTSDESETENGFEVLKFISEEPYFRITEQSLRSMKLEGIPDEVLKKLLGMKNQEITSRKRFLDRLKSEIGHDQTARFKLVIMNNALERGGAMGVIIISVFKEHNFVAKGFQSGAVDFIAKPFNTYNLQTQTLNAWMRIHRRESNRILQQRINDLIPSLKNGLVHYLTTPFSKLLLSVSDSADKIEEYAKDRYRLDPDRDTDNPLIQNLLLHKKAVGEAKNDWKNRQDALVAGDDLPKSRRLEAMLRHLSRSLLPCLTVKRTNLNIQIPERGDTRVTTFQNNVCAVLREVILGGVNDLPDSEGVSNITITLEPSADAHTIVRFEDDLSPISKDVADAINEGRGIIEDQDLGRAWGLSIAQHIAKRGGGELEIKPKKVRGNVITCKFQMT